MRLALVLTGLAGLALGFGCLNYTVDGKADHHREWAAEKGLPAPSNAIFPLGLAGLGGGGFLVGLGIGRRRPAA
jgi:hypothetical protein